MPLSPQEANDALKDISQTERRSSTAYSYRMFSPHLILWGIVWLIGYGTMAAHVFWNPLWPLLSLAGTVGSFWIGYSFSRRRTKASDWRFSATFVAIFLFIAALLAILPPQTNEQIGAFFPVLIALFYALIGIWTRGARMMITGAALAALTMIGFFWFREYFELWMTVVGGGGLILGGIWLRSA